MANFIAASTPGGIERQEKQGQIDQSFRETLPIQGTTKERPQWEAMGFIFGDNADDIFVNVKFPEGWKKRPTDHSMWTDLVDDKGRKRAGIFYKAAFYDRSSHVHLTRRFEINPYKESREGFNCVVVTDGDKEVHNAGEWADRDYKASDALREAAKSWLKENYPDWESASAYWD